MRTLTAVLVVGWAAAARAEPLTVEAAVARVIEHNPQLRAARERQTAAGDQVRAVRGQLLPSGALSDEFQHYDRAFAVAFTIPGAPVSPTFVARDQNTNTFAAAARQPLLGLVRLSQEYAAASAGADAVDSQLRGAEQSAREAVESAYLRLFEARAALEIARASQEQLTEQVTVAEARVAAGALTTADVLRVKVARANFKQQELQAQVQQTAARTQLLTMLGLRLDEPIEFAEPKSLLDEGAAAAPAQADAEAAAVSHRPEVAQAALQAQSAESNSRARLAALLPELDLEAAYVRVDGQAFAPMNQTYFGLKASWPIWTWGAQWYAHRAAAHQAEAARLMRDDSQSQVRAEVSGRLEQLSAASSAIDVAHTALESAEEAYRVTAALVKAGSGTTTDLLDAQSALTQARLNLVRSRYQQALSHVQLRKALGG